jgi:uncharacterized phage protein gp47/JayE
VFEDKTFDNLMDSALAQITADVDKQEGGLIRTAMSPCIQELAYYYVQLDGWIDLVTGDKAIGEYLDRVVADYGIIRKAATYAVRKVTTSGAVDIGTRWSFSDTTYIITALQDANEYSATCEQPGIIGNTYSGALEALDDIGDVTATLTDIITPGEEIETDDALRSRFYEQIRTPSTSGNAANYKKWALEVTGCGDAKIFPLWDGAGTVKVLVVDENMTIDAALPATVATYIETVRPIGAAVTVNSPTSKLINITANVELDGSKTLADVQTLFMASTTAYLKGLVFDDYSVSYAKIGSLLLATDGVQDYNTLMVNGDTANITIGNTEMPLVGTTTLTEVS